MASGLVNKLLLKDLTKSKEKDIVEFYKTSQTGNCELLEKSPEDKAIVDLDLVVEKWITYMWEKTKSKADAKHEFEELNVKIDWKRCDITQKDAKFDDVTQGTLRNQTLFKTYFKNNTDTEQEYSFRTERKTRQSCSFSFVKGFSREKEGVISFKLPDDILEVGGGLRSEQSVEMGKDETKEEEVTWGVDSQIKVRPHSKCNAELILNELEMVRNFKVEMLLKGRLTVVLTTKKDETFVKSFSGDITQILHMANDKLWMPMDSSSSVKFMKINGMETAVMEFSGKCQFRLGVEQHVNLNEEDF